MIALTYLLLINWNYSTGFWILFSRMDITVVDSVMFTMLFFVTSVVFHRVTKYFVNRPVTINKKLYKAVCDGHHYTLKQVLATNVDVNVKVGTEKHNLLHLARHHDIFTLLLSHGANVNALNADNMSPIAYAVIDNKGLDVVRVLLKHGADPCIKSNDGHSTLHFVPCLTDGSLEIVRELLNHGVDVNCTNGDNATPLFFAVMCETNVEIIKEYLLHGADISIKGRYPFTSHYFTVLQLAIDEEKVLHAKMIIKITLMKNFDNDYRQIIGLDNYIGSYEHKELAVFFEGCISEMKRMKRFKLNDNFSLFDLVKRIADRQNIKPLYATNQILEKELSANYPLYFEVFWPFLRMSLERADMLHKLRNLGVHFFAKSLGKEKNVFLNHDCLYKVCEYLSNDELLKFVLGFSVVIEGFNKLK